MPEISAAIARVQFDKLSEILSTRRKFAELYDSGLAVLEREGSLRVVRPVLDAGASSHHIYAVLVAPDRRASIIRKMAQAGVQVSSHFVPLHKSPYGRHVTKSPDLPITDRVAASVVRLPIYQGLTQSDVGKSRRCAHEGLERLTMPPTAVGMDLSVVLPIFKNRTQLPELYGRLTGVLSLAMPQYELVFVDDAGGDGSLEWLRGRVGSDPRVRLVEMGVNRGQHVAVVEGMAAATGSVVVVMDADLQDAPEGIPRLLDALRDEDAVIFARQRTRCQPRGRHTTGFLFKRVLRFVSGSRRMTQASWKVGGNSCPIVRSIGCLSERRTTDEENVPGCHEAVHAQQPRARGISLEGRSAPAAARRALGAGREGHRRGDRRHGSGDRRGGPSDER